MAEKAGLLWPRLPRKLGRGQACQALPGCIFLVSLAKNPERPACPGFARLAAFLTGLLVQSTIHSSFSGQSSFFLQLHFLPFYFYKLDVPEYERLLEANETKTYQKADKKLLRKIDKEARTITKKFNVDDRVESTAVKEAFITLKDHKENFQNKPTCRLINPSKPEIGCISKQILEEINR